MGRRAKEESALLYRMFSTGLSDKVTLQQRPEDVHYEGIWGRNILTSWKRKYTSLDLGFFGHVSEGAKRPVGGC